MPRASGSGFIVSGDGYFLTAHHVVDNVDVGKIWLQQSHKAGDAPAMLQWPQTVKLWPDHDLALLKLDFGSNANKAHLVGRDSFPFVEVDTNVQEEGAPVYGFGYPLPINAPVQPVEGGIMRHIGLGHRITSAVIASSLEHTRMLQTSEDTQVYVLDKALNYGNSGGPIVSTESGRAFAICSRFQPVVVPQEAGAPVVIPSLYGVVTSLSNISENLAPLLSYLQ